MWEEFGYESKEEYQDAYDDYMVHKRQEKSLDKDDSLTEITRELCRNRIESYMEELNELQEDS